MTQYQLYKNGGIPRSTISVTVDGKYKTVKLDTIYQIVATLGITLKEFFDDPLFDEVEDVFDYDLHKKIIHEKLHNCKSLKLYVTGLTQLLISVINYCKLFDISLVLYHYDTDSKRYRTQSVI